MGWIMLALIAGAAYLVEGIDRLLLGRTQEGAIFLCVTLAMFIIAKVLTNRRLEELQTFLDDTEDAARSFSLRDDVH